MKQPKGFTLIELLVVIAIIGLLSTMAVVSLNSARGKARDANRLSDVKQISNLIEMAAASSATDTFAVITCSDNAAPTAMEAVSACGGTLEGTTMSTFSDPIGTTACNGSSATACNYSYGIAPTATDYSICFYLEEGTSGIAAGLNNIGPGGVITPGCP